MRETKAGKKETYQSSTITGRQKTMAVIQTGLATVVVCMSAKDSLEESVCGTCFGKPRINK